MTRLVAMTGTFSIVEWRLDYKVAGWRKHNSSQRFCPESKIPGDVLPGTFSDLKAACYAVTVVTCFDPFSP
jgi:hypothetical protein